MTIRDSSSCHLNGRRNPADARPTLRDEAVRLHRCKMRAAATTWRRRARAFRALRVSGAHQAGCDPFARKRPEKLTKAHNYRLNIPALGLRRVVSSGFLSPPLPLAADDKTHQQQPLKCRLQADLVNLGPDCKTTHQRRAWPTWRFCSGIDWPCASAIVSQRAPLSTAMPLRRSRRYGSVMNGSSRKSTSDCGVPVLAKLLPSAGYRRCWNFRSLTGFTALGLMEVRPPPASHEPIRQLDRL